MYAKSIRITLKDPHTDLVTVCKMLRELTTNTLVLSHAVYVARCMCNGEGWEPPPEELRYDPRNGKYGDVFNCEVEEHFTSHPYQATFDNWEEQRKLLALAAAGDAEAAFEYCRRESAGENNHGCIG